MPSLAGAKSWARGRKRAPPKIRRKIELLLASEKTAEQVSAKCKIPTVISHVELETIAAPAKKAKNPVTSHASRRTRLQIQIHTPLEVEIAEAWPVEEPEVEARPHPTTAAENILRVDAERIDNVLNLVGELIIGKSMLQQALNEFAKRYPKEAIRGRFADAMGFQARVLNDLQRSVMKVRMVPVEQLFRRFPRMVRDVSRLCGKKSGTRNQRAGHRRRQNSSRCHRRAADAHRAQRHQSRYRESGRTRPAANKPAHGTIRLDAYHQGNQLIVEIRDDGSGIDPEKVKARAIEARPGQPGRSGTLQRSGDS